MNQPVISQLFIYPLKSARGMSVNSAELASTGFKYDRRFMLVDDAGKFFTQRATPQLAWVEVEIADNELRCAAPGMKPLSLSLELLERGALPESHLRNVTVWRHSGPAMSMGEQARAWFSQYLRQPADLVFMADQGQRLSSVGQRPISFVDAYPFLIISQASLDALNARLDTALPLNRFRPNIVITGCDAHAEDAWPSLRCRDIEFKSAKPCERCVITCTDQTTLDRGTEPLATLATYRRRGNATIFGQYFSHHGEGVLSTGLPLHVAPELEAGLKA